MEATREQLARLRGLAEQAALVACEDVLHGRDATEHARLAVEARARFEHLRDEAFIEPAGSSA